MDVLQVKIFRHDEGILGHFKPAGADAAIIVAFVNKRRSSRLNSDDRLMINMDFFFSCKSVLRDVTTSCFGGCGRRVIAIDGKRVPSICLK